MPHIAGPMETESFFSSSFLDQTTAPTATEPPRDTPEDT